VTSFCRLAIAGKMHHGKKQQLGNLFVLVKLDENEFYCYIFDKEEEIETFLDFFNISLVKNSAVYGLEDEEAEEVKMNKLQRAILEYARGFDNFPVSTDISNKAREFFFKILKNEAWQPDRDILKWIEIEYKIFNEIEKHSYSPYLSNAFGELEKLIEFANMALNRRKSRAGKSLEHHVEFVLKELEFPFSHPGKTEGNRKPDFLFPSNEYYKEANKFDEYLVILGAKTTCKDRWRQLITEGNKVETKHLITLQQGITTNQLYEMIDEKVQLVVPRPLQSCYPEEYQDYLWDINTFIGFLMEKYR